MKRIIVPLFIAGCIALSYYGAKAITSLKLAKHPVYVNYDDSVEISFKDVHLYDTCVKIQPNTKYILEYDINKVYDSKFPSIVEKFDTIGCHVITMDIKK